MLKVLTSKKRKWFSNIILVFFLILVVSTMYLSNIFKTPIKGQQELIEQSLVFKNKELENVTRLSLKNKSGEFIFERSSTEDSSKWHMTSPRDISVNSVFVEKLFSSLKTINTKKLLDDDKTNNSNFSLEKPTAILTLTDDQDKSIILNVGIMNTIDNSTYLKISEKPGIYHVEAPSISLENITLADLVESSVFDINFNTVVSFKIFKKSNNAPLFEATKKDGNWINSEDMPIDSEQLEDIMDDFIALKTILTLDSPTDTQKKQTQSLLSKPEYTIKIENADKKALLYRVSTVTDKMSEVLVKEDSYVLISENQTPIIYIVKKEFLDLLDFKEDTKKALILPRN